MLLFRSERHVEAWADSRDMGKGAVLSLDQAWLLARRWYGERMAQDWRRRTPAEATAVFAEVGLAGPFWDLTV